MKDLTAEDLPFFRFSAQNEKTTTNPWITPNILNNRHCIFKINHKFTWFKLQT